MDVSSVHFVLYTAFFAHGSLEHTFCALYSTFALGSLGRALYSTFCTWQSRVYILYSIQHFSPWMSQAYIMCSIQQFLHMDILSAHFKDFQTGLPQTVRGMTIHCLVLTCFHCSNSEQYLLLLLKESNLQKITYNV